MSFDGDRFDHTHELGALTDERRAEINARIDARVQARGRGQRTTEDEVDLAALAATEEAERRAIQEEPPTDRSTRFRLIGESEIEQQPPVDWRVAGILPAGALGALVGPYAAFKSFVALDMAAAVQAGALFLEQYATAQGQAVYVLGEGRGAFGRRIRAWKHHRVSRASVAERYAVDPLGLQFLPHPVAFMDRGETQRFIEVLLALPDRPALIVVDTLARCMIGGEENSARDVGLFIAGLDRVREATGAAVLVIHHTGKGGDTRGSSALPGALDVQILATADGDFVTLSCGKMKDAERFKDIGLRRRVIDLGDGTTSLVMVPSEVIEAGPRGIGDLPSSVRLVIAGLRDGGQRPNALAAKTALPERTMFQALKQAREWGLVLAQANVYRLTPTGERFANG